ncbi:MAG: phosphonate C-P lyase system protein PhnH [Pseudolabrys sp.]
MTVRARFDIALASQSAFRALMEAMARPGTIHSLAGDTAPTPLMPAAAALIRSLADYETPVWCDDHVSAAARDWIRFQTGAPLTAAMSDAGFAVIADAARMPGLASFAVGDAEYPDRSTTIIVQIESFGGPQFVLAGPGIKDTRRVAVSSLPGDFATRWSENRTLFPCGVDVILVAGHEIAALPRTVNLEPAGG